MGQGQGKRRNKKPDLSEVTVEGEWRTWQSKWPHVRVTGKKCNGSVIVTGSTKPVESERGTLIFSVIQMRK